MIPSLGAYYRASDLEEALRLLRDEPGLRLLAGGTDVLLEDEASPGLLDIRDLGLSHSRLEPQADSAWSIGATTRIEDLMRDPLARQWADGIVVGACLNFGTLQVRNMATVGGNVAHALPAADLVPALIALDAEVELVRLDTKDRLQKRRLALQDVATGPFATQIAPAEIISRLWVPAYTRTWRAQFRKIGRVLKDLSQVNCAVALDTQDENIQQARIVVGAVHPVVARVPEAERLLEQTTLEPEALRRNTQRAVEAVRSFVRPIDDLRGSKEWRRYVVGVLVQRCLDHVTQPENRGRIPQFDDGPLYRVGVEPEAGP